MGLKGKDVENVMIAVFEDAPATTHDKVTDAILMWTDVAEGDLETMLGRVVLFQKAFRKIDVNGDSKLRLNEDDDDSGDVTWVEFVRGMSSDQFQEKTLYWMISFLYGRSSPNTQEDEDDDMLMSEDATKSNEVGPVGSGNFSSPTAVAPGPGPSGAAQQSAEVRVFQGLRDSWRRYHPKISRSKMTRQGEGLKHV
eukprot:Skav222879  [mRNA]  locus=scaffold1102:67388:70902:- [translate_table: standard]